MKKNRWLKHTSDPKLEAAANKKIRELQCVENDIPGVLIVHNLVTDSIVYLSGRGCKELNVTLEEIQLPHFDYHLRFFNPEDVPNYLPKVLNLVERNRDDEMVTLFQQVRIHNKGWQWYCSSIKILLRNEEGLPVLALTVSVPVDEEHYFTPKIERLITENTFLREHQKAFSSLSKREKEILRLLALGNSSTQIANELFIAEATVNTHRKKIKNKLSAETNYDLLQFAQAFNLI